MNCVRFVCLHRNKGVTFFLKKKSCNIRYMLWQYTLLRLTASRDNGSTYIIKKS
jgi:hypothetical protein